VHYEKAVENYNQIKISTLWNIDLLTKHCKTSEQFILIFHLIVVREVNRLADERMQLIGYWFP